MSAQEDAGAQHIFKNAVVAAATAAAAAAAAAAGLHSCNESGSSNRDAGPAPKKRRWRHPGMDNRRPRRSDGLTRANVVGSAQCGAIAMPLLPVPGTCPAVATGAMTGTRTMQKVMAMAGGPLVK